MVNGLSTDIRGCFLRTDYIEPGRFSIPPELDIARGQISEVRACVKMGTLERADKNFIRNQIHGLTGF